jgi:hypothetical protein
MDGGSYDMEEVDADEGLQRPDGVNIFMPLMRMQHFAHLAYGLVDPASSSPASCIRHALGGPGGNPG